MLSKRPKSKPLDLDGAFDNGVAALTFIAADDNRLAKFFALTGISPDALVADARSARMLCAVLEHLAQDESLLLVFAAEAGIPPERITQSIQLLEREP